MPWMVVVVKPCDSLLLYFLFLQISIIKFIHYIPVWGSAKSTKQMSPSLHLFVTLQNGSLPDRQQSLLPKVHIWQGGNFEGISRVISRQKGVQPLTLITRSA